MKTTWFGLLLWSLILLPADQAVAQTRRVLLLHSFGANYPPWGDVAGSLRADLVKQSRDPIDLYEASVFAARFESIEENPPFAQYLKALFAERKLDLVVTFGAPAAFFVQRERSSLFASTPLLIAGADVRRLPANELTADDAVVAWNTDYTAFIDNILRVRPETDNIEVVVGNSPVERYWVSQMREQFRRFDGRTTITWLNDLPFDRMLDKVSRLGERDAVLYFQVALDAAGAPYDQAQVLEKLRAAASAPVFGPRDSDLGRGIVGGPLLQTWALGQQAAGVAIRILAGEQPRDIKSEPMPLGAPIYDWRELRRWSIDESLLPPNSIVQFRQPSGWDTYRWRIIVTLVALLTQTILIAGLMYERRRRQSAEVENRRRIAELAIMNRRAAVGAMSASIAHEIKQPLTAIVTNSNVCERWLAKGTPNIEQAAAVLKRIISDAYRADKVVDSIRSMFKKDEPTRDDLDINEVVREVLALLRVELAANNVIVKTALSGDGVLIRGDRIQLQQVVLNLVRNAIDAMNDVSDRPRIIKVGSFADGAGVFLLKIEDSGPGIGSDIASRLFEPFVTTKANGMGMGLSICRSIIEAHGGRLSAASSSFQGAAFEIALPIAEAK